MERDMTVGSLGKMILQFTFPLFIGNVFQQLYNMVDTIIVGKFVGANSELYRTNSTKIWCRGFLHRYYIIYWQVY